VTYLLDTSVCVAVLRGRDPVLRRLAEVGPGAVAVSAMTAAELRYGVLKSRDPAATGAEVERFLGLLEALPFDEAAAEVHARVRRALEVAGQPIGERELVIAATALAHGLPVATGNTREFRRVSGLAVEDWTC
jgi:tRNA(fMet)-specific endonuclease VapC